LAPGHAEKAHGLEHPAAVHGNARSVSMIHRRHAMRA
jgi:hypothetical protein